MATDDAPLVRRATPQDVPAIQRIAHAGWRTAYGGFLDEAVLAHVREEWHTRDAIRRSVQRDDVSWFVACERDAGGGTAAVAGQGDEPGGERVVGYASGGVPDDADHAVVGTLYVAPDRWGEGYGSAVFDRVVEALGDRDADRVEISVFAENDVGRSFYESRGFDVAAHTTEEIAGEPVEVVVYESGL